MGMTDIKETIQGLYALKTYLASKAIEEAIEGHDPARESLIGMQKVVDSAVNLLKEQKPKLVVVNGGSVFCPTCGNELYSHPRQKFCDECGQEVKW